LPGDQKSDINKKETDIMTLDDVEEFKTINDFPNYEISSWGRVFKKGKAEELIQSPTLRADLTVGLMKYGIQYRRSVKVLVANAFVDGKSSMFNTPIQLDGDKFNTRADNIQWRPRGFAWEYSRQFTDIRGWFYEGPVLDVTNNVEYENIFEAAIAHGSLCKDIRAAIPSGTHVFPTGEKYTYI
jgi:hypothetical protein